MSHRYFPTEGSLRAVRGLPPSAPPRSTPAPPQSGAAVPPLALVVEDESLFRLSLRNTLERAGYRVLDAPDRATVRAILPPPSHPDGPRLQLALVDVLLPDTTGASLGRWLEQSYPRIGVVYMSGHRPSTLMRHRGIESVIHPLVTKPFDEADLWTAIREALARSARSPRLPRQ